MNKATLDNIVKDVKTSGKGLLNLVEGQKSLKIGEELILDVLSLPDLKKNPAKRFELLEELIKDGSYTWLIQEELLKLVSDGSIFSLDNIDKKFSDISSILCNKISDFDIELIMGFVYILEAVYARGIDVRKELIWLLRCVDSDISSKICDFNVIIIKMAMVAYGANKYNCYEQLECLDYYANYIKKNGLSNLKGAMHYYYAIFKERFPNCVSSVYSNDIRHSSYGHLLKSKKKMFRLAEIKYNYF